MEKEEKEKREIVRIKSFEELIDIFYKEREKESDTE